MVFGRHCRQDGSPRYAVAGAAGGRDNNAGVFTVATTVSSRGRDVRLQYRALDKALLNGVRRHGPSKRAKKRIVIGMRADPEPDDRVAVTHSKCPITKPDAG